MTLEKPKTVADVLEAAADLLEKPGAWTQFHYARNERGGPCSYESPQAACFCAMGAIGKVAGDHALELDAARSLGTGLPVPSHVAPGPNVVPEIAAISNWNDASDRRAEDVVSRLRSAASLSRQNEEKANGETAA